MYIKCWINCFLYRLLWIIFDCWNPIQCAHAICSFAYEDEAEDAAEDEEGEVDVDEDEDEDEVAIGMHIDIDIGIDVE